MTATDTTTIATSGRAVRNLSTMTGGRIVTQVVLIVSAIVIPRALGTEAFGEYATLMALVVTLEVVGSGGLHLAETRFVAPLFTSDRDEAVVVASRIWSARTLYSLAAAIIAASWLLVGPSSTAIVFSVALVVATRSALEASRQLFLSVGRVRPMVGYEVARAVAILAIVSLGHSTFGLAGVMLGLAGAHGALFVVATMHVRRTLPLRFSLGGSDFGPLLRFGAATMVGLIAWIGQAQVPVYVLGTWASPTDAAVFAVAVQIYALGQALLVAPFAALMPILSELDTAGRRDTLQSWAGSIVSWGVAGGVLAALGWALTGDGLLTLLPDDFEAAHAPGTWLLVALLFIATTPGTNAVLYATGAPARASANQVVFAGITIAATVVVVSRDLEPFGLWLGFGYALAAAAFAGIAHLTLRRRTGIAVPIANAAVLASPLALLPLIHRLDWPWLVRVGVALVFAVTYLPAMVRFGILPMALLREGMAAVRQPER